MIQYDKDGATIFYTDATGNKVSASVFDGKKYSDMLAVMDAQISAANLNQQALSAYATELSNANAAAIAGRPVPAPQKPQQKVVSDTGAVTWQPFSPPLADVTVVNTVASSGSIAVASVDTEAVMYSMITAIYRKMFPSS